jgi:hypothetical protein
VRQNSEAPGSRGEVSRPLLVCRGWADAALTTCGGVRRLARLMGTETNETGRQVLRVTPATDSFVRAALETFDAPFEAMFQPIPDGYTPAPTEIAYSEESIARGRAMVLKLPRGSEDLADEVAAFVTLCAAASGGGPVSSTLAEKVAGPRAPDLLAAAVWARWLAPEDIPGTGPHYIPVRDADVEGDQS